MMDKPPAKSATREPPLILKVRQAAQSARKGGFRQEAARRNATYVSRDPIPAMMDRPCVNSATLEPPPILKVRQAVQNARKVSFKQNPVKLNVQNVPKDLIPTMMDKPPAKSATREPPLILKVRQAAQSARKGGFRQEAARRNATYVSRDPIPAMMDRPCVNSATLEPPPRLKVRQAVQNAEKELSRQNPALLHVRNVPADFMLTQKDKPHVNRATLEPLPILWVRQAVQNA